MLQLVKSDKFFAKKVWYQTSVPKFPSKVLDIHMFEVQVKKNNNFAKPRESYPLMGITSNLYLFNLRFKHRLLGNNLVINWTI